MITLSMTFILSVTFMAFATKRLLTYLHVLQQDDYGNARLRKWIGDNKAFDKRLSLALVALSIAWLFVDPLLVIFCTFFAVALAAYVEKDPRKNAKKKLVTTTRTKRILIPALLVILALSLWALLTPAPYGALPLPWIAITQLIPFILMLSNTFLQPIEHNIQQKYWDEAHEKVKALNPTVIGVTGSFGKTSIKHILGHILKSHAPTLITPGSVNTPMGIARIVREELDESHKFFIVEMGAYGKGSIKRLCDLTPPDMGIIAAVGHAHYERFGTLDTVACTKYELAEAVLQKDEGQVVIHERTLRFDMPRRLVSAYKARFTVVGDPNLPENGTNYLGSDDYSINTIEQKNNGLQIGLSYRGKLYTLQAPIFGAHHAHNIALAFAAAIDLGISAEDIGSALKSLPQIAHRLEVKPQNDGTTIIDDAFNSNPIGFRSALDLLGALKPKDGRAILITPGMVEMGAAHDEAHRTIGKQAGKICDVALVVAPKRIPSFIEGFKETGADKEIIKVDSFRAAALWLDNNKRAGDHVLIENDLPDMYERVPKM